MESFNIENEIEIRREFLSRLEENTPEHRLVGRINSSVREVGSLAAWRAFYRRLNRQALELASPERQCAERDERWLRDSYFPAVGRFYWVMDEQYTYFGQRCLRHEQQSFKALCEQLQTGGIFMDPWDVEVGFERLAATAQDDPEAASEFSLESEEMKRSLIHSDWERKIFIEECDRRAETIFKACESLLPAMPEEIASDYRAPLYALARANENISFAAWFGRQALDA